MKIDDENSYHEANELEVMAEKLPLAGATVLELGCGAAFMTRRLATELGCARIIATEVDRIQHEKNLQIEGLGNVEFVLGGAEAIDLPPASVDLVVMLKSLHHVPTGLMDQALAEIHRVLVPDGFAYLSEPVYRGDFNDIMRLFHDEKQVRGAAFAAIRRAVAGGGFTLVEQIFFNVSGHFRDFDEFENRMLKVTHTEHRIDTNLHRQIQAAFQRHMTPQGADFLKPMRVDLLRKR